MYKTVQTFIANRIYIYHVATGGIAVPVIFVSWFDEAKNLANVWLYGSQGIAHTSCLFMPQTKFELDDDIKIKADEDYAEYLATKEVIK